MCGIIVLSSLSRPTTCSPCSSRRGSGGTNQFTSSSAAIGCCQKRLAGSLCFAPFPLVGPVVARIAESLGSRVEDLIAQPELMDKVQIETFQTERVGLYTLHDIREELRKPGRDPREKFSAPQWREDVREISDLTVGMILEGTVTNVTNFGAFVDVGVHQDGLVHVSELSARFIKDPKEAVKVGQIVRVKVLSADPKAKRIALSVKALETAEQPKQPRVKKPEEAKPAIQDKLSQLASRFRTR